MGWVKKGGQFFQDVGGRLESCLACDLPVEYSSPGVKNHDCPAKKKRKRRRGKGRSVGERLNYGFRLLGES